MCAVMAEVPADFLQLRRCPSTDIRDEMWDGVLRMPQARISSIRISSINWRPGSAGTGRQCGAVAYDPGVNFALARRLAPQLSHSQPRALGGGLYRPELRRLPGRSAHRGDRDP